MVSQESLRLVEEGGSGMGEYLPEPGRETAVACRRCAVYSAAFEGAALLC